MIHEKKLNIAIVTNNYTPYAGGVVSSINSFAHELMRLGHIVSIITLDFLGTQHTDPPHVIRIPCPIKFTYHQNPMAIPWLPGRQLAKIIDTLRPDIIHSQHPFLLGSSVQRIAHQRGISTVFTYHTRYEDYLHYLPVPQFLTRPAINFMVDAYCNGVNQIIAPTATIKQGLEARGITTPITVIPSGLQPIFAPEQKPNKHKKSDAPFQLLVVSRFVQEKNLKIVLDLFTRLDERYILTLIGYGPEFEPLRRYAYDELRFCPERVIFLHKPEKEIIAQAYRTADLFLFSSITDVQPLALVEAMAAATPIIALSGHGREIIQDGFNGFVVTTTDQMVAKIRQLEADTAQHARLQDGAWQTAQRYWPQETAKQLLAVYRENIVRLR